MKIDVLPGTERNIGDKIQPAVAMARGVVAEDGLDGVAAGGSELRAGGRRPLHLGGTAFEGVAEFRTEDVGERPVHHVQRMGLIVAVLRVGSHHDDLQLLVAAGAAGLHGFANEPNTEAHHVL